jgi:hypothetical protein
MTERRVFYPMSCNNLSKCFSKSFNILLLKRGGSLRKLRDASNHDFGGVSPIFRPLIRPNKRVLRCFTQLRTIQAMRGLIWCSSFREDFNMKNLQCTSDNSHQVMAKVHLVLGRLIKKFSKQYI